MALIAGLISNIGAQVGLATHDQVVDTAATYLSARQWKVEREPQLGAMRPDMIATDPGGATYVIEVKTGKNQAMLGAVAQVEAYRDRLKDRGVDATGVLVLAADAPSGVEDLARSASVEIVRTPSSSPSEIRAALGGFLGVARSESPVGPASSLPA
jgi:RecB family endonuclease NucS